MGRKLATRLAFTASYFKTAIRGLDVSAAVCYGGRTGVAAIYGAICGSSLATASTMGKFRAT